MHDDFIACCCIQFTQQLVGLCAHSIMDSSRLVAVSLLLLITTSLAAVISNPAQPCVPGQCKPPNCRCAGVDIPGGLTPSKTPQIVLISFDDGLRTQDYEGFYASVFNGRKNPNGCQIGLTFFASHYYTNYALLEDINKQYGYEMAVHTIDHNTNSLTTKEEFTGEIMGMKEILCMWGNVSSNSVRGFRAPFLATNEAEIQVLYDNKFLYEASMSTDTMYWPFTLDYKSPLCNAPATCPNNAYPGLWIVPVINLQQKSGYPCNMLDACTDPQSNQDWIDLLTNNFNAHYNGNRAPMGIYAHSSWFYRGQGRDGVLKTFLDKLATMQDVFVITHAQMLDWVRNPTPLDQIKNFVPWNCSPRPQPRCDYHSPGCLKWYADSGYLLSTCTTPCPRVFPQYGNLGGN